MSATLLEMEKEVLEEGREWTRKRFEERLQQCADQIPAVCEQSGLVLKRQHQASFTLMTVSGTASSTPLKILADNPADALICREVNYFQNHYFQNHRDHLNYADLAARDAPIGSGSMESVCS